MQNCCFFQCRYFSCQPICSHRSNICCPRDAVSRTANVGTVGTNGLNFYKYSKIGHGRLHQKLPRCKFAFGSIINKENCQTKDLYLHIPFNLKKKFRFMVQIGHRVSVRREFLCIYLWVMIIYDFATLAHNSNIFFFVGIGWSMQLGTSKYLCIS